jgi:hypothetical protein
VYGQKDLKPPRPVKSLTGNTPIMKHSIFLVIALLCFANCQDEPTKTKQTRLLSYTESYNLSETEFQPQTKVQFTYDASGRLEKSVILNYDNNLKNFQQQRYLVFHYDGAVVTTIEGYFVNSSSPYINYVYSYVDSKVKSITENNAAAGVKTQANFTYIGDDSVSVAYTSSNGAAFEYIFEYKGRNITADKATSGSQLCSEGTYSFDQQHNPFSLLGYTDFLLFNLSVNNKLSENVSYTGCAFPQLNPVSYEYAYNELGYPLTATTFYKTSGATAPRSRKEFVYQ